MVVPPLQLPFTEGAERGVVQISNIFVPNIANICPTLVEIGARTPRDGSTGEVWSVQSEIESRNTSQRSKLPLGVCVALEYNRMSGASSWLVPGLCLCPGELKAVPCLWSEIPRYDIITAVRESSPCLPSIR